MITLYFLCVIYTYLGFRRFKKLYGNYDILDEEPKFWTILLNLTTLYILVATIVFTIMYLP